MKTQQKPFEPLPASDLFVLRSRVKSNDDWLRHSENLYREEQKRIGAYARQCRESSGVTLRELARRMKISAPFLSDLEKGNRHWTDGTLTAWEDAQRTNDMDEGLRTPASANTTKRI